MTQPTRNQQRPVKGATPNPSTGSHATAHRRHGAAWLPWAILGLLALLALGIWALANAADDDDDDDTSGDGVATTIMSTVAGGTPGATAAPAAGTGAGTGNGTPGAAATTVAGGAGGATGNGATAAAGSLTANGQDLFTAAATSGGLASFAGAQASGAVRVESVVSDEGFWVGSSPEQRIFVFLTPEARGSNGESPFQVAAGQMVSLTGTVTTLDPSVMTGIDPAEGAEQLTSAGHYVRATAIQLVG